MKRLADATISLTRRTACRTGAPDLAFETLTDLKTRLEALPEAPDADWNDFRRAADNVRLAMLGAVLCAAACPGWSPDGTALIGLDGDGCARNNRLFWDDYTAHGYDAGRASLFVPTLPSIPVCEAAITLKLRGPVRYILTGGNSDEAAAHLEDLFAADPAVRQIMTAVIRQDGADFRLTGR